MKKIFDLPKREHQHNSLCTSESIFQLLESLLCSEKDKDILLNGTYTSGHLIWQMSKNF